MTMQTKSSNSELNEKSKNSSHNDGKLFSKSPTIRQNKLVKAKADRSRTKGQNQPLAKVAKTAKIKENLESLQVETGASENVFIEKCSSRRLVTPKPRLNNNKSQFNGVSRNNKKNKSRYQASTSTRLGNSFSNEKGGKPKLTAMKKAIHNSKSRANK